MINIWRRKIVLLIFLVFTGLTFIGFIYKPVVKIDDKIPVYYFEGKGEDYSTINIYLQNIGDFDKREAGLDKFLLVYITETDYIENILDNHNIELEYLTGLNYIGFSLYFPNNNVKKAFDIAEYFFSFDGFNNKDIQSLKKYYKTKIKNYDLITEIRIDGFNLYREIEGDTLNKIDIDSITNYYKNFASMRKKVLFVGNLKQEQLEKSLGSRMTLVTDFSENDCINRSDISGKNKEPKTGIKFFEDFKQSMILVEAPISINKDDDIFSLFLCKYYLGERLNEAIRSKEGLAYSINIDLNISDLSLLVIDIKSRELLRVMSIFEDLAGRMEEVDLEAFRKLKKKCAVDFCHKFADNKKLAEFVGSFLLVNDYAFTQYNYEELYKHILSIENISLREFVGVIKEEISISVIGRLTEDEKKHINNIYERLICNEN